MNVFVPLALWADGEAYGEHLLLRPANTIRLPAEDVMLKVAEIYRVGTKSSPWNPDAWNLLGGVLLNQTALYIARGDWDSTAAAAKEAGECYEHIQDVIFPGVGPIASVTIATSAVEHNVAVLCAMDGDLEQAGEFCRRGMARIGSVTPDSDRHRANRNSVSQALVTLMLDLHK